MLFQVCLSLASSSKPAGSQSMQLYVTLFLESHLTRGSEALWNWSLPQPKTIKGSIAGAQNKQPRCFLV
jgi:hypothetical protein